MLKRCIQICINVIWHIGHNRTTCGWEFEGSISLALFKDFTHTDSLWYHAHKVYSVTHLLFIDNQQVSLELPTLFQIVAEKYATPGFWAHRVACILIVAIGSLIFH